MYETKFEIMQGVEDGIEMFKKLIKPIMVLALFSFLVSLPRIFTEPSYLEVLNRELIELDTIGQLMNQLVNFIWLLITGAIGVMLLYYYKEDMMENISLGEKIISSIKCSVKMFLATIAVLIPLGLLLIVGVFISLATRTVVVSVITGVIFFITILIAMPLLTFSYQGMVFDDMGAFKAIFHSAKLVKHNYFRLLLLMLLLGGASMIITTSLRFNIVGIVLSMMISAVTSKLFMCINTSIYLQARPEEMEIYE